MTQDDEKAMNVGAENTDRAVLDKDERDSTIRQDSSEVSSEKQENDSTDTHSDEASHHSDKTAVKSNGEPEQQAEPKANPVRQQEPVPRSQRRGLLGSWTIIPEVVNPYDYPDSTKWTMTVIVAICGATSSTGSSVFYPALNQMSLEFNTTATVVNLSMAFYMLAMAFTPLWWSSFSETLGRRTIYLISFALFVIFSVISAVSVNVAMLIVFRTLSGGAAASVQAVGAGTAADIWEPKERGKAMGLFFIGPICGPGLAPIIGGALSQNLGWRSTLWFLTIFGGVLLLLILFALPETVAKRQPLAPESASQDAQAKGVRKIGIVLFKRFVEPLKILFLLQHPPILVSVYAAAIAFGCLFVLNMSIQANFSTAPYYFNDISVGLLYIAPTIGYAISSLAGGRWIDHIMAREARRAGRYDADGKLQFLPEDRMRENIWIAASLYPAALIWYGWVVQKEVAWIASAVASAVFGLFLMLVFGAVTTMLTEFTPRNRSGGVALNNFLRNIFSCTGAVVTQPLIDAIGTGWMCTMIGLFAWVTTNAVVLALRVYGPRWRVSMDRKLNA